MIKLFGGKKQSLKKEIESILNEVLEKGKFSLSFQISEKKENTFQVDIFGEDEGLLKTKEGRLLQAFQTYFLCVLKKQFPESKSTVIVDSNGFWEERLNRLFSLVEELIEKAVKMNRPMVLKKALPPNERRLVHERVSEDKRIKSLSFGEGFYKNIKFIPNNQRK